MKRTQNPLLFDTEDPAVDLSEVSNPVLARKRNVKREIKDARRVETARESIVAFDKETELYGFTKGQFSLIDLLKVVIEKTGPVHLSISTWTAAGKDATECLNFLREGKLLSTRWLVDRTFHVRQPTISHQIRQQFGHDAIRVASNHAKFSLLQNDHWQVVVQTSMNLNANPRFENFNIAHDPELAAFLANILDEVFAKQKTGVLTPDWKWSSVDGDQS